jgi:hypothetical protein
MDALAMIRTKLENGRRPAVPVEERAEQNRVIIAGICQRIAELAVARQVKEWDELGDDGRAIEKLAEAAAVLGDRSFVDALGLNY